MDSYWALRRSASRVLTLCAGLTLSLFIPSVFDARAEVLAVRGIGLTVSSLDRTERFYRDTLDFRIAGRRHLKDPSLNALFGLPDEAMDVLTMQLGDQQVEFTQFEHPGRPYPADSRSPDLWFQHFAIVVSDMDAAYARVRAAGVEPISLDGPETLPERNGHVRAFKFRDPDGHPLELLWFPPGQGRPVWHQRTGLFLGIDHSAIAVASTETSLAFYHGLLGLSVTYGVTNEGATQERLDGIADAVVRITGIQPSAPEAPGIEFLDYRKPASGRPAPDVHADDTAHAHLTLAVRDLPQVLASPGLRWLSQTSAVESHGVCSASIRDPDGHVLVLEEAAPVPPAPPCGATASLDRG
jgi:catechol 2,3-dioxygenase-like lactoylglutathione lyase family enzyme